MTVNRFYYDRKSKSRKKKCDPVGISYSIEISPEFIQKSEDSMETDEEEPIIYDLYSIIIHAGTSAHCGHYYTIGRDSINNNGWKIYNDCSVTSVKDEFIEQITEKMKSDTPYMLFYK